MTADKRQVTFVGIGIDYIGPLLDKFGRSHVDRYGCLFTGLTTRAVKFKYVTKSKNGTNPKLEDTSYNRRSKCILFHLLQVLRVSMRAFDLVRSYNFERVSTASASKC